MGKFINQTMFQINMYLIVLEHTRETENTKITNKKNYTKNY